MISIQGKRIKGKAGSVEFGWVGVWFQTVFKSIQRSLLAQNIIFFLFNTSLVPAKSPNVEGSSPTSFEPAQAYHG